MKNFSRRLKSRRFKTRDESAIAPLIGGLQARVLAPLVILFMVFGASFVWVITGLSRSYSELRVEAARDREIHVNVSNIIRLSGKAKEALLLYRLTESSDRLLELTWANLERARAIDFVSQSTFGLPAKARFARAFGSSQARFQRLQSVVLDAIRADQFVNADRALIEWESLERLDHARQTDFLKMLESEMRSTDVRMRTLLQRMVWLSLLFLAAGGITVWVIGRYYQKRIIAPLSRLSEGFNRVSNGDLDVNLETDRGDIGDLARMSAEFNRMTHAMRESRRDLRTFVSVAAHDLRSPLSTIRGFADLLSEDLEDVDRPEVHDSVQRIERIASRALGLTDRLLGMERADSGSLMIEDVVLSELIIETLENLDADIRAANARIAVKVAGRVRGDRAHLRGLFQNLVSNSLKYQRPGVAPEIDIVSRDIDRDDTIYSEILIRDNGVGFDNASAGEIFVPFKRLENAGDVQGFGVGLATCRRIVERHNGRITASGELGQGAEFRIELPQTSL